MQFSSTFGLFSITKLKLFPEKVLTKLHISCKQVPMGEVTEMNTHDFQGILFLYKVSLIC